jgi:hypothetical protein
MSKPKSTKKSAKNLAMQNKQRVNQITLAENFDPDRVFFDNIDLKEGGDMPYYSVPIGYLNEDGTIGSLIIQTPRLWSYGVSIPKKKKKNNKGGDDEEEKGDDNKNKSYTLSLSLYDKQGATEEQKKLVEGIDRFSEKCVEHLVEIRKKFKKPKLEARDLSDFNPIWRSKDEDGEVIPDSIPNMSPKLVVNRKTGKVTSLFFDQYDQPIDPLSLLKVFGHATCLLRFEYIYIGGAYIRPQIKVQEVTYEKLEQGFKPMMARRPASSLVTESSGTIEDMTNETNENEEDNEEGSVGKDDDNEEDEDNNNNNDNNKEVEQEVEQEKPKSPTKKIIRKKKTVVRS